jgi:signal transduction histidine kinase
VSLTLKLRLTEAMTPQPSSEIRGELSLVADELAAALEELQEVSRGIHPAILSAGGLAPALRGLARRSPVPIALELRVDARLDESVEVTAYYVVSEAFTNAAKHAEASMLELRAETQDDALVLVVRDDGVGGADAGRGSGLIGLTDRVQAIGGTLSVVSPPGDGTTLYVRLPLVRDTGGLSSLETALAGRAAASGSEVDAGRRPVRRDDLAD